MTCFSSSNSGICANGSLNMFRILMRQEVDLESVSQLLRSTLQSLRGFQKVLVNGGRCVWADDKILNHHVHFMGCLYLSLPFCTDARISHLPNAGGRTTVDSFLSLLFLFHLGRSCHFNTLNTSRFEEKADFAGLKTIVKRKENLAKRSMEEVGIQGGRKGG